MFKHFLPEISPPSSSFAYAEDSTALPSSSMLDMTEESYSAWDVEVASIDLTSNQMSTGSQWTTIVGSILTTDYLETLVDALRNQSSLPELVTVQLLQHLLRIYQHKVEVVVQEQGIDAIDTSLTHFKVITNRKQGTKRLELVFDHNRIKDYLKHSLAEFFTHAGIWREFAQAVGTNLVIGATTDLDLTKPATPDQSSAETSLLQTVSDRLHGLDLNFIIERSEVLAQIHCLDIATKIVEGLNVSNCSFQDMEKLMGLKQRPLSSTRTSLNFDPIVVLPTSIPIASSIRAQLRPDLWQQSDTQAAVFHYRSKTNPSNYIEHYITNPGDIEMLPWEAAEQIINKFGFDTVKLQLIFAARTMEESEPWKSTFTLKATDIIHLLGWDKNHNTSLADKRNAVASTAYALSCLLVKSVWIEGRGKRKVDASTPIGRMWDILIDLHGQFDWVTGKIEKPDEVYITVSPGLWTKHFLNRAGSRAKEALHQFGYLARDILKIDPYHNELTLRLAIQLTLDARIRVRNQNPYDYRVGSLLEEVLAKVEIDRALQDKHKARDLKNRWNNALKLLISLGWEIQFDPETYPGWLRPGSVDPKPEDWRKIKVIDRLMQAKLTIVPPQPIPTLLAKIKEPKLSKSVETTPTIELTGDQVRQAREQKGWSRKELGGFLNLSADYVGKLERGDRMITTDLHNKLKRLLNL